MNWMSSEILDILRHDRWFKKFKIPKLTTDYYIHVYLRNQASYKVEKAKSEFYTDLIAIDSHQPTKPWKVLNDMGATEHLKLKSDNLGLVIEDKMCYDKCQVACHCNKFFMTVAASLALYFR